MNSDFERNLNIEILTSSFLDDYATEVFEHSSNFKTIIQNKILI